MNSSILAVATLQIIANSISGKSLTAGASASADAEHKSLRIKNLLAEEIVELVAQWDRHATDPRFAAARLVVATDLGGRIPETHVAEEGNTITWYRNHIPPNFSLVYLETEDQSDAQGLQNFFTLRDSNYLDGSFDATALPHRNVIELLIASAWNALGSASPVPSLLLARVEQVIRQVHRFIEPVPVRKFIQFAVEACTCWKNEPRAKDEVVATEIIGGALWRLDLFPDDSWRDAQSEPRTLRRLELNSRHADLRSPSGDLDPDILTEVAKKLEFRAPDGTPLPNAENQAWRQLCMDYIASPENVTLRKIPYSIFEQLFRKDTKGMLLGDRVWSDVHVADATRILELERLDVVIGLNQRSQPDAERLLTQMPEDDGAPMLVDLLSVKTRKMVERLANPPARTFVNPVIEIARQLERTRSQLDRRDEIATVLLEPAGDPGQASVTLSLFAFLYGRTLWDVSDGSREAGGVCKLDLDERLATIARPPSIRNGADAEGDEDTQPAELIWPDLPLRMKFFDSAGQLLDVVENLLWKPSSTTHLAMFWLLVADDESPVFRGLGGCRATEEMLLAGSDWMDPFVARIAELSGIPEAPSSLKDGSGDLVEAMIATRREFRIDAAANGLSVELINSYFDQWQRLMEEARQKLVPDGTRIPAVDALLAADSIMFDDSFRLMLPTQPLRLRWIGHHLDSSSRLLVSLLEGRSGFAARDGESYLEWLENRSPHEVPPMVLTENFEIIFSRSERSWFEEYARFETGNSSLDDDPYSIDAICQRINAYIDAHPYKTDGLSILLLLPSSDSLPAEILERLNRAGLKGDGRLMMTIAAPKSRWESIARAVELCRSVERNVRRGGLFPLHDLAFVEFDRGSSLGNVIEDQKFDIGIVSHLLNGSMQQQQNTEPVMPVPGKFDPLLDRTTQMVTSGDSGATSIIMKPRNPDAALETWGTLIVRSNRTSPVSRTQPENTDYVELRLNFDESAGIFNELHRSCHWVITLERHVSRKQIESIEAGAPDILSIMDGVGANGLNTLVVSSRSGRELIESRLVRKLRKLLPPGQLAEREANFLELLAKAIYDETRRFAPHLALNAMGVSRVTEEILGLAVARTVADQLIPLPEGIGRSAWVSLDEHSDWFGGVSATRADMCRFTFTLREDGVVSLGIVSLEGKLRQTYDPHGVVQADVTRQFLHDVLGTADGDDARTKIDSKLWRERFLSAIESCAIEAVREIDTANSGASESRWQDIRHAFREGNYVLDSEEAIYSICLWESMDEEISIGLAGHVITVKSSNKHVLSLVRGERGNDFKGKVAVLRPLRSAGGEASASFRELPPTVGPASKTGLPSAEVPVAPVVESSPEAIRQPAVKVTRNRMGQHELQRIYDEILACFAAHGVAVGAACTNDQAVTEGPASILFKVKPGPAVDPKRLYEKSEALKLHLGLEQEQNVGFDIDRGYVTIDVPKSEGQRYFVDAQELWSRWRRPEGALAAPIGEDRNGNAVEIVFSSSNSPHLLIGGTTGSGKSEALNTILYGLVSHYGPQELRLLLVDPKGTELNGFENYPHLDGNIGWEDVDAIQILDRGVQEMENRYARFRANGVRLLSEYNAKVPEGERLPWWLVVLDEYADLTSDPQNKKEIEKYLKRLAQKARAAGIHLVIATQKPSAEVISTNLRSNLPAQLALKVKSSTESRVIMDGGGAETLNGKGDAYLKSEGKVRRVQCARVDLSQLPSLSNAD